MLAAETAIPARSATFPVTANVISVPVPMAAAEERVCGKMAKIFRILGKEGRITIPYDIRLRIGFAQNDILSFTEDPDGASVTIHRESLCSGNCLPDHENTREGTQILFEFLNSLTYEQQCAALYHLNAIQKGKKDGIRGG